MLIFYPRLPNGNVVWSCDNCDETAQVSEINTNAVALVCNCDMKVHPECNDEWYYKGLYWNRIPKEKRNQYSKARRDSCLRK